MTSLAKTTAIPDANANTIHTKSTPQASRTTPDGPLRRDLPRITEGSRMGQSIQGCPIPCS